MKKFFNRCKANISMIIRIFFLKITFLIKMKFFRKAFYRNIDFSTPIFKKFCSILKNVDFSMATAYFYISKCLKALILLRLNAVKNKFNVFILE